ncbi:hypothetical protein MRS44_003902 [Fusarium solani]|uniref:uncharacterized protein n=1 Tax=Fusarium solani TaxID=169388 RepID=UPI0032C4AB4D|nr:hypothetical protein MRS44_003902 [Fusarium solani]
MLTEKNRIIIACSLILLLFSISTCFYFIQRGSLATFIFSLLTLLPLSSLIRRLEFILAAILSNISELLLVLVVVSLSEGAVARMVIVGLIVSDCLLSFGAGLLKHGRRLFDLPAAEKNTKILLFNIVIVAAPTLYKVANPDQTRPAFLLSRIAAVFMFTQFLCYLFFIYRDSVNADHPAPGPKAGLEDRNSSQTTVSSRGPASEPEKTMETTDEARVEDQVQPQLAILPSSVLLVMALGLHLMDSIYIANSIKASSGARPTKFIGLVLVPCALASGETLISIVWADPDYLPCMVENMTCSMIRTLACIDPLAVILGWILHADLDITLDVSDVAVLGLSMMLLASLFHSAPQRLLRSIMCDRHISQDPLHQCPRNHTSAGFRRLIRLLQSRKRRLLIENQALRAQKYALNTEVSNKHRVLALQQRLVTLGEHHIRLLECPNEDTQCPLGNIAVAESLQPLVNATNPPVDIRTGSLIETINPSQCTEEMDDNNTVMPKADRDKSA